MSVESILNDGVVGKHHLWTDDQKQRAREIIDELKNKDFLIVRVAWVDQHGILKSKRVPKDAFLSVLKNGLNISCGTFIFDTGYAVVFNPFIPGGGFNKSEMTGCPNFTLVPDPLTFRYIPWTERTAIIMCDIYFEDGRPTPFSSRQVYQKALDRLHGKGMENIVGLEVEWYLTKIEDPMLAVEHNGEPGFPPSAPLVSAVEHGYWYQVDPHDPAIHDFLEVLAENLLKLGLPLRTMENEWGPGQFEFVFDPLPGLEAADGLMYFKMATKHLARKYGYLATFMCRPKLKGFYSSGWHLHQSLVDKNTGQNLFMSPDSCISELGKHYIGGILKNGAAASVFTTPTINGYKRFKPNSLAPTRLVWGTKNRGAMINVHGKPGDPATHIENRVGEPGANPYLYMASQVISGLHGLEHKVDPGTPSDTPYDNERDLLPTSLIEAVEALKQNELFEQEMGEDFIRFIVAMKESEINRYLQYVQQNNIENHLEETTEWEQREYFEML